MLFDESLNRTMHQKQLDLYVRYWNDGLVKTRFLTAEFLGHATADDEIAETDSCGKSKQYVTSSKRQSRADEGTEPAYR